eukprot:CAMPEP_0172859768 /NCGR_PEP_ID=MMETSP1075-20121228/71171_1 /TAXON_ID=2916 /ORGANISM="Ceratium fusus, Strain PA161109" /LENGTH=60 /DNA_ID=CAMNT_0013707673 /DNA_START=14 /DNA_END=193 /DNA_ORIENTATION=+
MGAAHPGRNALQVTPPLSPGSSNLHADDPESSQPLELSQGQQQQQLQQTARFEALGLFRG